MANRRDDVTMAPRLSAAAAAIFAAALALPAAAQAPNPAKVQPPAANAPAANTPAANAAPGQPKKGPDEAPGSYDPDARRTGTYKPPADKKKDEDDGKREMVGQDRLWTTRDPPGKRGVFAFLGNKLGDPIANLFPDPNEKDQFGGALCRDTPGIPDFLECTDDSVRELVNGTWKLLYRGVEISFLNYRYLDGKLVGFRMGFPTANFEKLSEVLKKQYGNPTGEEDSSWKHRLGGVFDIKTLDWNTPVGEMSLKSRAAALDAGMLALMDPKAEAKYSDLRYRQVFVPMKELGPPEDEFVIHPPTGPGAAQVKSAIEAPRPGGDAPKPPAPAAKP